MRVTTLSHKSDAQHLNFRAVSSVAADPFNVAIPIPVLYVDGIIDNQRSADSTKNAVAKFRTANRCADTWYTMHKIPNFLGALSRYRTFTIDTAPPRGVNLRFRVPSWAPCPLTLLVNNQVFSAEPSNGYVNVSRYGRRRQDRADAVSAGLLLRRQERSAPEKS